MATVIITDSTAYLPQSYIEQEAIHVVPLKVSIGEEEYIKETDLSNQVFYDRLIREPIFPRTSQPSSGEFLEIFNSLQPGDIAIAILISAQISGTVQSASMARDMLGRNDVQVHVIDSQTTSVGLALMVMEACEMRAGGTGAAAILKELERIKLHCRLFFIVDNLEYLARGGRVSHVSKHIGNFFHIKPVLHLEEGKIQVFQKIRTRHKAINKIVKEFESHVNEVADLMVTHVRAEAEAEALVQRLASIYSRPITIMEIGPVIGSHVGPGTIGIAYYSKA